MSSSHAHALPLQTVELAGDLTDVRRLSPLIGTARVVALGEPTHGAHEPLAFRNRRGTAGDRYHVVVHVDATALRSGTASPSADAGQAVVELDGDAEYVSAETCQRLACEASVVVMHHRQDGSVVDVGRKTRTIPAAIRRALAARDRGCQFPGCTARRCDGHHIRHWADGGTTSLDNLVLLCRRHHRAVHEEGFRVRRADDGAVIFCRPDGTRLAMAPAAPSCAGGVAWLAPAVDRVPAAAGTSGRSTVLPVWTGERLDLVWAIDVLRRYSADAQQAPV